MRDEVEDLPLAVGQLRERHRARLPAILGLLIGTNLAVFAAWPARAIPVYPLVVSLVGWLVFFFPNDAWLPTLSTTLVAPAWCGVIVLRTRDGAWDRA